MGWEVLFLTGMLRGICISHSLLYASCFFFPAIHLVFMVSFLLNIFLPFLMSFISFLKLFSFFAPSLSLHHLCSLTWHLSIQRHRGQSLLQGRRFISMSANPQAKGDGDGEGEISQRCTHEVSSTHQGSHNCAGASQNTASSYHLNQAGNFTRYDFKTAWRQIKAEVLWFPGEHCMAERSFFERHHSRKCMSYHPACSKSNKPRMFAKSLVNSRHPQTCHEFWSISLHAFTAAHTGTTAV